MSPEFWSNPKIKTEKIKKQYRYTKKTTHAADRGYIEKVKSLPCSCCGASPPSSAHHIREGQGTAQKADNFLTIALCFECHQGVSGLHGDKTLMRIQKIEEIDLLSRTIEMLYNNINKGTNEY